MFLNEGAELTEYCEGSALCRLNFTHVNSVEAAGHIAPKVRGAEPRGTLRLLLPGRGVTLPVATTLRCQMCFGHYGLSRSSHTVLLNVSNKRCVGATLRGKQNPSEENRIHLRLFPG